jgi:hypothetical protein
VWYLITAHEYLLQKEKGGGTYKKSLKGKMCIYVATIFKGLINKIQGSHYFKIRGRSDFSFRELTGRSGRLLGELNCN